MSAEAIQSYCEARIESLERQDQTPSRDAAIDELEHIATICKGLAKMEGLVKLAIYPKETK